MVEEGEKIYTFGPGIFSTPERWRARFNHCYVGMKNLRMYDEVRPQPEDYAAFRKAFPVRGGLIDDMTRQGKLSAYSTGLGSVAGGLLAMRLVRAPPIIILSSFITALTSYTVGNDVGSWIYGTYKFDNNSLNTEFLTYVRDHRRESKGSDTAPLPPSFS